MDNSRFAYGEEPTREEVYFYANHGEASFWLVTTNSRLLLVKATLEGPELDVRFEVTTPEGSVPFEGTHLLMARDWAPISHRGPLKRRKISDDFLIELKGVTQPVYVVKFDDAHEREAICAWTYVRVDDSLRVVETTWVGKDEDSAKARLRVKVLALLNT